MLTCWWFSGRSENLNMSITLQDPCCSVTYFFAVFSTVSWYLSYLSVFILFWNFFEHSIYFFFLLLFYLKLATAWHLKYINTLVISLFFQLINNSTSNCDKSYWYHKRSVVNEAVNYILWMIMNIFTSELNIANLNYIIISTLTVLFTKQVYLWRNNGVITYWFKILIKHFILTD